jgi:hypothetical protein
VVRTWTPFLAVFTLALAFRAPYLGKCAEHHLPLGVSETERAAVSLARTGVLGGIFAHDSGPSAHAAPLYPWLLARVYQIADWQGVDPRPCQVLLMTLLSCGVIGLVPLLARRGGLHPGAGWAAAVLLCVLPGNRALETTGFHEQPLLAGTVTVVLLAFMALHKRCWRSPSRVALAALLTGLSALLSPVFLSAVALVMLAEWLTLRGARRAVLLGSLVVVAGVFLILFPWAYRNHRQLGGWIWTRSNFGLELWIGNNPQATGQTFFPAYAVHHPFVSPQEAAEHKRLGELEYTRRKGKMAREWIRDHPGDFARLTARRVECFWFPNTHMVWGDGAKWVAYVHCVLSFALLAGLARLFWTRYPYRWLLLATLVGFSLPHLMTHVDVRYRYPLCGIIDLVACDFVIRGGAWCWRWVVPGARPPKAACPTSCAPGQAA